MRAIYKRELRSYFFSFTGWLFAAVNLFVMIPILTMRSLSEERKNKTDQLILTAPVSVGKIVLGKYFALVTVLFIPTAFMGILPFFLMRAGEFSMGVSYAALLGFFLYGSLALAVGLFLSSLTENVVFAAGLCWRILWRVSRTCFLQPEPRR